MGHHTKDKGDFGVAMVVADLARHGCSVCVPMSEHLAFDLIAVSPDQKTSRVQVKYAATKPNGTFTLKLRSSYSTSKGVSQRRIDSDNVDGWAVYNPEAGVIYIPVDAADGLDCDITFRTSKTERSRHVASDFKDPSVLWRPRRDSNAHSQT